MTDIRLDLEIVAGGPQLPDGPIARTNGASCVEIERGTLTRMRPDGVLCRHP